MQRHQPATGQVKQGEAGLRVGVLRLQYEPVADEGGVEQGVRGEGQGRPSSIPDTPPRQTQMGLREMAPVPSLLKPAIESCRNPMATESPRAVAGEEREALGGRVRLVMRTGSAQVLPSADQDIQMSARSRSVEGSTLVESNSSHAQ